MLDHLFKGNELFVQMYKYNFQKSNKTQYDIIDREFYIVRVN